MDLLENYKKAWANQPEETNKVSKVDIYKMAQEKSSSIVKWIFIIGILEFVILNSTSFIFMDSASNNRTENLILQLNLVTFFRVFITINYIIVAYFLYQFYKNYKNICVNDNTKTLMLKILKTRKTVKQYVAFNLLSGAFVAIILVYGMLTHNFKDFSTQKTIVFVAVLTLVILLFLTLIWFFYQLLYGILLKKLNRNYKELAKLDELK